DWRMPMSRLWHLIAIVLVGLLVTAPSYAAVVLVTDTFISGDTIFFSPIAQLTFTNAGTNTVSVEVRSLFINPPCPSGRTCYGGLSAVLFNVDPSITPGDLLVGSVTNIGSFVFNGDFGAQNAQSQSGWPGGTGWEFRQSIPELGVD